MKYILTLIALGSASGIVADQRYMDQSYPYEMRDEGGYQQNRNPSYYQDSDSNYSDQPMRSDYRRNDQPMRSNQPMQNDPYQRGYQQSSPRNPSYAQDKRMQYNDQNQRYYAQDQYDNRKGNDNENEGYYDEQRSSNKKNVSDQELSKKIRDALSAGWISKGHTNVDFEVNAGNVTLRGSVNSIDEKNKVEESIRKIKGVKSINNQISIVGKTTANNDAPYYSENASKARDNSDYKTNYPQDFAATDADRQLNAKIREKLSGGWLSKGYENLIIKTSNGVVIITGVVDSPSDLHKIDDKLKDVSGIKSLKNQAMVKNK